MIYIVENTRYSFNYKELKEKHQELVSLSDSDFMSRILEAMHLACIIGYFKDLPNELTISDKGIIHELLHLLTDRTEPTNDLKEIRSKFNHLIKLA